MIHGVLKGINNTIKKKIDLSFLHDEIFEQKVIICIIRYIKKIYLYLMNIRYTVVGHVHMVRMTIHLIDIYL